MKIVTLNIWGGRRGEDLLKFFQSNSHVDVFLLQEVFFEGTKKTVFDPEARPRIFHEIQHILRRHIGYFAEAETNEWGLAVFINKDIQAQEIGDIFVHRWKDALEDNLGATVGKNLQYISLSFNNKPLLICNFHGLWNGMGKSDTDDRLRQSEKVREFIGKSDSAVILAGDFNLSPDTESLRILEDGMRNLIKEYGIASTRTSFYERENKFADYVLVAPSVEVKDFRVLPDEVSDHAPLFLEI